MLIKSKRDYFFSQKIILLAGLCLILSSCGWQLRGVASRNSDKQLENLSTIKVDSENRSNEFYKSLRKMLGQFRIQEDSAAEVSIRYTNEEFDRRPLAYGSTGIPVQYQLTMSIEFESYNNAGERLLSPRKIIVRRNYDFDAELIIEKEQEEQQLLREMREELAAQMLRAVAKAL